MMRKVKAASAPEAAAALNTMLKGHNKARCGPKDSCSTRASSGRSSAWLILSLRQLSLPCQRFPAAGPAPVSPCPHLSSPASSAQSNPHWLLRGPWCRLEAITLADVDDLLVNGIDMPADPHGDFTATMTAAAYGNVRDDNDEEDMFVVATLIATQTQRLGGGSSRGLSGLLPDNNFADINNM